MFIPIGTDRSPRRPPLITPLLILVTCGVSIAFFILKQNDPNTFVRLRGEFWVSRDGFEVWQLWTHTLLHAGMLHLAGNMIFLWVFGRAVEDKFGKVGFLALYMFGAAAAALLHIALEQAPAIGASGATAAVTGAFLVLFPRTRVKVLFIIFFGVFMVPAWWVLGLSIAIDLVRAVGELAGNVGTVAVFAHLGGYALGMGLCLALLKLRVLSQEEWDLFTVMRQRRRRAEIRAAARTAQASIRRVQQPQAHTGPAAPRPAPALLETESAELAEARAAVTRAVAENRLEAAAAAYDDLVRAHGESDAAVTLSRDAMLAVGGELYQAGKLEAAVAAYERFLTAYGRDREAPMVRLLVGRAITRTDAPPERLARAAELLAEARDGLDDEGHKTIALEELDALRARTGGNPSQENSEETRP